MHYIFIQANRRTILLATENVTVTLTSDARVPTTTGEFRLYHYVNSRDEKEHLALVMGDVQHGENILVRVHSECFTGDVLGSLRCDCGEQLHKAMQLIAAEGRGVIVYLRQEGRGIGLAQKLQAYNLQDQGYDTVEANLLLGHQADEREYSCAATILADLAVVSIRLLTNNPAKIEHLRALGVQVQERLPLESTLTEHNTAYLMTKVQRMQHLLTLPSTNGHAKPKLTLPAEVQGQVQLLLTRIETHSHKTKRPFVTLSYAQSLDGSIAALPGQRLSISSPEAMTVTHALRANHDAILVGINTVLIDNPKLTVRLVDGPNPQPIVLDSHARMPLQANLLNHPKSVWIATTQTAAGHTQRKALEERGAKVLCCATNQAGRVDLGGLLDQLGAMGVRSLMVEGGAQILTSFLRERLIDYAAITVAPRFVGGVAAVKRADQAQSAPVLPRLANLVSTPVGPDLLLWGKPVWEHGVDE